MNALNRVVLKPLALPLAMTALLHCPKLGVAYFSAPGTFDGSMPPHYLATITVQENSNPAGILWGEAHDGLAVGIAQLRTSVASPAWPVLDAYLGNSGSAAVRVIQSRERFRLELDGQAYSSRDEGGPVSLLSPGKQFGPIVVDSMWFHKVDRLAPNQVVDDGAPSPALTAGKHSLRLYFNCDNELIASAPVTFTVRMQPYPMAAAVAQITKDLHDRDSYVRSMAATVAGRLQLSGARAAVTEALNDPEFGVRNSAARTLGIIGDKSTIAALKPVLNDRDMNVRVSAITSLVELGEPFDTAWAEPIIRSKQGNAFQNAIWLVRRNAGQSAAPTLIRCLDMDDPSVRSYYNYTLVSAIGACGGPPLKYHHDFDGNGTLDQVENNRKVLAALKDWLRDHEQRKAP